jgi:hypothetical protein
MSRCARVDDPTTIDGEVAQGSNKSQGVPGLGVGVLRGWSRLEHWRDRGGEGELRVQPEDAPTRMAKPWGGPGIGRWVVADPWTNARKQV